MELDTLIIKLLPDSSPENGYRAVSYIQTIEYEKSILIVYGIAGRDGYILQQHRGLW